MTALRLPYFSWWGDLIIGLLYSMFVFSKEFPEERPPIFSKLNKRSPAQILLIHGSFLVFLFLVEHTFAHIGGYLPHWITEEYDMGEGPLSAANVLFFIGASLLAIYEKHVLFPRTIDSQAD